MSAESTTTDVPVVVVGGGPVGLAMAWELAHHGVASVLVEPRLVTEHSRPRAKTTSARTMELFRRTGAAAEIRRRAAIPVEWSSDVRFCTTVTGTEITRLHEVLGLELIDSDLTAEAAQQVTQATVEDALRALIAAHPLVDTRFGSTVTAVDLAEERPRVQVTDAGGTASVISCEYVVGADGSRSIVRTALGARYEGAAGGRPNVNITFRSAALAALLPAEPAIHHWVLNPSFPGVVGPLTLDGTWWAIATGLAAIDDDDQAAAVVRGLVGADIDVEVLATDPWQARMLLADSYGSGRAYLVGDAAHQNPPWGGHGYNTGVGDAVNLAFKLAGVVQGWAPPEILLSYGAERRPVEQQTIELAASNMRSLSNDLATPAIMDEGPEGDAARAAAAAAIPDAKRAEFSSLGLVLGYGYGPDARAQAPTLDVYRPIAAPGNRLPHSRNADRGSLYDELGIGFTLLASAESADRWTDAAARRRIPFVVVDAEAKGFPPVASGAAVLVRPDQHIAWIGPADTEPGDVLDLALRGFLPRP